MEAYNFLPCCGLQVLRKGITPTSCEGPQKSLLSTAVIFEQLKTKQPPSPTKFGTNNSCSETLLSCLPLKPAGQLARVGLTSLSPDPAWLCPRVHGGGPPLSLPLVAVASVTQTSDVSGAELCSLPPPSLCSPSAAGQTSCCCPEDPKQRAY